MLVDQEHARAAVRSRLWLPPVQKLSKGVDLVVLKGVGKAEEFAFEHVKPSVVPGQDEPAGLDLGADTGGSANLVTLGLDRNSTRHIGRRIVLELLATGRVLDQEDIGTMVLCLADHRTPQRGEIQLLSKDIKNILLVPTQQRRDTDRPVAERAVL